ncbi:MAG: hemolysin family protein [Treponema sp.]|nr:hemolysin family protein [Treponema sp.]
MDASYYIGLIAALAVLLGLSAFFSSCETSFSSLSKIKLKNMAAKHKPGGKANRLSAKTPVRARLTLALLNVYDTILSTILVGNTLVNIAASALATMLCIGLLGAKGVSIATITMTVIILVFTEITPKTLAKESPELTALRVAPLLRFFMAIFAPFNYLAGAWKKVIVKIFPVKTDRTVTEDELLTFVEEVRQEGGINKQEEQMIRQVIAFDNITAADIVTPRIDVAAISENSSAGEIDRAFAETGFSRLPVFRENIDTISGVILFKDFHYEVIKKGRPPLEIIKPVVFVTKTMKISRLLQTLQKKQSHLAVLVDEFGGTLGIVTIEDILEELVGEIWDEHDEIVEPIRRNANGSYTVLGSVKFQEMLEYIDGEHTPEEIPNTTIGSWILETAGTPPRINDQFTWNSLRITVSRMQRQRILETILTTNHTNTTNP